MEASQIYITDSDETQIVDNENETVSRCEILPRLCQTLSASCTNGWIALYVSTLCCHFTAEKICFPLFFLFSVKLSYTSARRMAELLIVV